MSPHLHWRSSGRAFEIPRNVVYVVPTLPSPELRTRSLFSLAIDQPSIDRHGGGIALLPYRGFGMTLSSRGRRVASRETRCVSRPSCEEVEKNIDDIVEHDDFFIQ